MKKEKLDIQGMTCTACSSHVDRATRKLEGVKEVNVNLLANNMSVEYDENKVSIEDIIQSVKEAGYGAKKQEKIRKIEDKNEVLNKMKQRLIVSIIFLIPLMYLAMYHMFNEWFGLPIPGIVHNFFHGAKNALNFSMAQLILLIPIIVVNRNYFIIGFKRLFQRSPNMDSLIAIGSSAAILYGFFAISQIWYGLQTGNVALVDTYSMDIYFESAGTILTLITLGKYLETRSKGKTSQAIQKLIQLEPKTAIVIRDGKEVTVKAEEVKKDETLVIKPGASIPVDGVILEGKSSIDQSAITGESIPQEKEENDEVIAGTVNQAGYLKIKATKVGEDTTLAEIIRLVEEAANSKAPISKLADKVSGVFVPIVIVIAIIATALWLAVGQSFEFAISIGIAVLVISCPCALGLATPVAIMVGTGKAAEHGILIKTAESLESLHLVDTVVLDKTGTVTKGKPSVVDIIPKQGIAKEELLKIAGSLEQNSEHSLATAILEKTKEEKITLEKIQDFEVVPGRGVKGKIDHTIYLTGNQAFMKENNIILSETESQELAKEGKTPLYFANETQLIGIIAVADELKETSFQAIENLKKMKLDVVLLTGDNKLTAEAIGAKLQVNKVISEVLPQEKEKEIVRLQEQGKKVAFVGDGINDSPALARANVGIAIGSGTDIAIESADIVLMKNSILDVVTAIKLSKSVIKNIKMNLFWAFFYNTVGIPIAAGVLYPMWGLKLNPMLGALAMSLSSVCVVTNALRLRFFKPNLIEIKKEREEKEEMKKEIVIEGMQCEHCKMAVEKHLSNIEGVKEVSVDLESKTATVILENEVSNEILQNAVEEAGYTVNKID